MNEFWANHFDEIPMTLEARSDIREAMAVLIVKEPIHAKEINDEEQLRKFRGILIRLTMGEITFEDAEVDVKEALLPLIETESNWAKALLWVQYSRFYNQTVLDLLRSRGQSRVLVPQVPEEGQNVKCNMDLGGKGHSITMLYDRLVDAYTYGKEVDGSFIPNHPFCTHVVKPFKDF